MRSWFVVTAVLLCQPLALVAQTDAQRALNNEPESKQVQGMSQDLQAPQQYPPGDPRRQSQVGKAVEATASLRQMTTLSDQLEDRLNREARACNFCPEKQEELSELIRQRVESIEMTSEILGHERAPFMMKLAGITPGESRWTNIRIPYSEASDAVRAHCARFNGPQEEFCKADGVQRLAGEHEKAWSACFNKNNWVEVASRRRAYEMCMSTSDPFTKMCEHDRKAGISCPYFTVNYMDVHELHFYHDRWITDPEHLPATAVIVSNQPAHVTLLEPIVTPPMPPGPGPNTGFTLTVRGRLDNALEGEYDPGLSPETGTIAQLNPGVTDGLKGMKTRVELIAAGSEVQIQVRLGPSGGLTANGGQLNLQVDTHNLEATRNGQLISQSIFRHITWPATGTVLMAATSSLSFATQCGCSYPMSVAEFRKLAAAHAAAPPPAATVTRTILAGSRIQTVLLEPVTVSGIQAGKRFHAQLNVDMTLPAGMNRRTDAIELKQGADVYLKVTDTNNQTFGGHMGKMAVDYVVFNGQQVALNTPTWPVQFAVPAPNARRSAAPAVDVIVPAGHTTWWDIAQEAEVSTTGMNSDQVKRNVPPPDPNEVAQYGDEALRRAIADYNTSWINHGMLAKGTVSRVEQNGQWEMLHFRDADDSFVVCFPSATFYELRGADDFSGLVGKTVEIRGRVAELRCKPKSVGIEISVPPQIHVVAAPTNGAAPIGRAGVKNK